MCKRSPTFYIIQFKVLIKWLLMAYVCRHCEARQIPETPECWRLFSTSSWPEVCRARTKSCKQVWTMNYCRTKRHYLVKITSCMTYNHISLSQKEPDKRKMIQNGSEISANVTSEHFSFLLPAFKSGFRCSCNGSPPVIWTISLHLWYQVYFVIIIV